MYFGTVNIHISSVLFDYSFVCSTDSSESLLVMSPFSLLIFCVTTHMPHYNIQMVKGLLAPRKLIWYLSRVYFYLLSMTITLGKAYPTHHPCHETRQPLPAKQVSPSSSYNFNLYPLIYFFTIILNMKKISSLFEHILTMQFSYLCLL